MRIMDSPCIDKPEVYAEVTSTCHYYRQHRAYLTVQTGSRPKQSVLEAVNKRAVPSLQDCDSMQIFKVVHSGG